MPDITVYTKDGAKYHSGGNLKVQIAPGVILIVDYNEAVAIYNLSYVDAVTVGHGITN